MTKHESATVHVTQVERLKPFLCLRPPECLQAGHVFFLTEFSEIIDVLLNVFSIDIDHLAIAIDIVYRPALLLTYHLNSNEIMCFATKMNVRH